MRRPSSRTRLLLSALAFTAIAGVWAVDSPLAWACPTCPAEPICSTGPYQLCKTVTTCSGNTCTTEYYYYT